MESVITIRLKLDEKNCGLQCAFWNWLWIEDYKRNNPQQRHRRSEEYLVEEMTKTKEEEEDEILTLFNDSHNHEMILWKV
jgi:thiaminase